MKHPDAPEKQNLLYWYKQNARELPWRKSHDPYRIWISEIMLQQTTVTAVRPFYEKFMSRFPSVEALANAPVESVLESWSGLGYYSRARNLHAAAKKFHIEGFPQSFKDLLAFPGLGPYTARAIASIAFDENVGVLDGNVIRVLSRIHGLKVEWWKPAGRTLLQAKADEWVKNVSSRYMNQALMELGATICIPQNPKCLICPVHDVCCAFQSQAIDEYPLLKPRRESEIWFWEAEPLVQGNRVGLIKNEYAPFLKGQWIWPGTAKKLKALPANFDYQHTVTHHKIYVRVKPRRVLQTPSEIKWVERSELRQISPTSLIQKALPFLPQS